MSALIIYRVAIFSDEKHQLSEITWGRGEASSLLLKVNLSNGATQ